MLDLPYNNFKDTYLNKKPVVVCSFGDASITEGEVAEAFQMASLKQLPILYLVGWWRIPSWEARTDQWTVFWMRPPAPKDFPFDIYEKINN